MALNLEAHYILCLVILSLDSVALVFLLFPLPRAVWRHIHRFAIDERPSIRMIRRVLKGLLIISTLFVLSLCFESLIRIIHFAIQEDRYGWRGWNYYYGSYSHNRKRDARDSFFFAGATFLVSLAFHRVLYIVVTHLNLQEQLKEVNGKDVQSQPKDLSSEWLYKRRTMKDVRDTISSARTTIYKVGSSLGFAGRIRLPASPILDAENGLGNQFRDEIIARQESEITNLRRALSSAQVSRVPSPTASDNGCPGSPGLANVAIPSGVEDLISSQEREIAELKNVIKGFSENLKAQAAAQAAEYDRLASQFNRLAPEDAAGKGKDMT